MESPLVGISHFPSTHLRSAVTRSQQDRTLPKLPSQLTSCLFVSYREKLCGRNTRNEQTGSARSSACRAAAVPATGSNRPERGATALSAMRSPPAVAPRHARYLHVPCELQPRAVPEERNEWPGNSRSRPLAQCPPPSPAAPQDNDGGCRKTCAPCRTTQPVSRTSLTTPHIAAVGEGGGKSRCICHCARVKSVFFEVNRGFRQRLQKCSWHLLLTLQSRPLSFGAST